MAGDPNNGNVDYVNTTQTLQVVNDAASLGTSRPWP